MVDFGTFLSEIQAGANSAGFHNEAELRQEFLAKLGALFTASRWTEVRIRLEESLAEGRSDARVSYMVFEFKDPGELGGPKKREAFLNQTIKNLQKTSDKLGVSPSKLRGFLTDGRVAQIVAWHEPTKEFIAVDIGEHPSSDKLDFRPLTDVAPWLEGAIHVLRTRELSPENPNVYLAVYTDWLLESEGVPLLPNALAGNTTGWTESIPTVLPQGAGACVVKASPAGCWEDNSILDVVEVTPYSPTAIEIAPGLFAPITPVMTWPFQSSCNSKGVFTNNTPSNYSVTTSSEIWVNVSLEFGSQHSYLESGTTTPWLFVTNLTPDKSYSYSVSISAQETATSHGNWCGKSSNQPVPGSWGANSGLFFSGTVTTKLQMWDPQLTLRQPTSSAGPSVHFAWTNSMLATASVRVKDVNTSQTWTWTSTSYGSVDQGSLAFSATAGNTIDVTFTAQSRQGGWTQAQLPALSNGTYGSCTTSCPAQVVTMVYGGGGSGGTITVSVPSVKVWSLGVSNITASTALVSWQSNVNAAGYVIYALNYTGASSSVANLAGSELSNGTAWAYAAELHGLEGWAGYTVSAGVLYKVGNLTQNVSKSTSFSTTFLETVWEEDLPYDSVSHTGGGAAIRWAVSPTFAGVHPQISNGTLWVWNATTTEIVPISPSELNNTLGSPWSNWLNITLSGANQTYGFVLQLNYSSSPRVTATSVPTYFTYQLDSSGDGLTNLEKQLGWGVTVTTPSSAQTSTVYPYTSQYSSSGLYNDYLEKEYDLDPVTVDTASSGMLDFYNLTFDLGSNSSNPSVPFAYTFQLWWEVNSSYNPFSYAPYPGGPNLKGVPLATDLNNLSCGPGSCAADSAYSAEVLWSTQALDTFLFLPGVDAVRTSGDTLKGILGTEDGERTLTVWGKLSWGADPQNSVTPPGTYATDGSRLSPLLLDRLQVQVSNLYVGGLGSDEGYAARFRLFSGPTDSGAWTLSNFTAPVGERGGITRLTGYTILLPVVQTSQYETLQIQIFANESGSSTLTAIEFNSKGNEVNLTYDMFVARSVAESYSGGGGHFNPNASLSLTLQSVDVGQKAPTYLWAPTQNGTTNGLPLGLERYTGEQSFDLILVNASTSLTSGSIPYPWGGSYTVSLQSGLNNLLVPREQFLNSSFAAAIFEAKTYPYPTSNPIPQIISGDSGAQSTLTQSFGTSTGWMYDLESYWQNRSIANGHGNFSSRETGVSNTSAAQLRATVVESAISNNSGGLANDPGVYSSIPAPPAIQSIATLNVTTQSTLDLLLASLLTNTTNGINGTLQSVTNFASDLSLDSAVLSAIANAPAGGQGVYGPPGHNVQTPSPGGPWSDFVNGATSIATTVAGAVVSLEGIIYTAGVDAFTYLNHLATEACAIGAFLCKPLARVAATLVSIGKAVLSALDTLLNYILSLVKAALATVVNPVVKAASEVDRSVAAAGNSTITDYEKNGTVSPTHALAWANSLVPAVILGDALGVVVVVALTLITPFALGANFLMTAFMTVLPTIAQNFIAGLPQSISFSSSGVLTLQNDLTAIPKSTWEAIAGTFAIIASGGDLIGCNILLAEDGAKTGAAAVILPAVMAIDIFVLMITIVNWAPHLAVLVGAALALALVGTGIALIAVLVGVSGLEDYAGWALLFSLVGLGAAGADYILEGG